MLFLAFYAHFSILLFHYNILNPPLADVFENHKLILFKHAVKTIKSMGKNKEKSNIVRRLFNKLVKTGKMLHYIYVENNEKYSFTYNKCLQHTCNIYKHTLRTTCMEIYSEYTLCIL